MFRKVTPVFLLLFLAAAPITLQAANYTPAIVLQAPAIFNQFSLGYSAPLNVAIPMQDGGDSGSPVTSDVWAFGDGVTLSSSTTQTVTHRYSTNGNYTISLTVAGITTTVKIQIGTPPPPPPPPPSVPTGLGLNLAVIGRLVGSGNTLFKTSVDVSNSSSTKTTIDFYFTGESAGQIASAKGSISTAGLAVPKGRGGNVVPLYTAHFDDFIDSLVQANLLPMSVETNGILGSVLFVFNNFTHSGEGMATARIYDNAFGGTIGQSILGKVITTAEPIDLIVQARNSVGISGPQLYPNLFVNNTGLTTVGQAGGTAINVVITAYSNTTGGPIGTYTINNLAPGATTSLNVWSSLALPQTEDTVLLTIDVATGTSSIEAYVAEVDNVTHNSSALMAQDQSSGQPVAAVTGR